MSVSDDLKRRALDRISNCTNPRELRTTAENADRLGHNDIARAAYRKLYSVLPQAEPGTLEFDVWQSIYALEGTLKEERGKTILLARTRQKIGREGEVATVADLITRPASEGYRMLVDRNMPELSFEAVALRHPAKFDAAVIRAATDRLVGSGFNPEAFS